MAGPAWWRTPTRPATGRGSAGAVRAGPPRRPNSRVPGSRGLAHRRRTKRPVRPDAHGQAPATRCAPRHRGAAEVVSAPRRLPPPPGVPSFSLATRNAAPAAAEAGARPLTRATPSTLQALRRWSRMGSSANQAAATSPRAGAAGGPWRASVWRLPRAGKGGRGSPGGVHVPPPPAPPRSGAGASGSCEGGRGGETSGTEMSQPVSRGAGCRAAPAPSMAAERVAAEQHRPPGRRPPPSRAGPPGRSDPTVWRRGSDQRLVQARARRRGRASGPGPSQRLRKAPAAAGDGAHRVTAPPRPASRPPRPARRSAGDGPTAGQCGSPARRRARAGGRRSR